MQVLIVNVNQRELGRQIITVKLIFEDNRVEIKTFIFEYGEWVDIHRFTKDLKKMRGFYP